MSWPSIVCHGEVSRTTTLLLKSSGYDLLPSSSEINITFFSFAHLIRIRLTFLPTRCRTRPSFRFLFCFLCFFLRHLIGSLQKRRRKGLPSVLVSLFLRHELNAEYIFGCHQLHCRTKFCAIFLGRCSYIKLTICFNWTIVIVIDYSKYHVLMAPKYLLHAAWLVSHWSIVWLIVCHTDCSELPVSSRVVNVKPFYIS